MNLFLLAGGAVWGYAAWKHTPVFENPVLSVWVGFWGMAVLCAFLIGRKNGGDIAAIAIAQAKAEALAQQAQQQSVNVHVGASTPGLAAWVEQYALEDNSSRSHYDSEVVGSTTGEMRFRDQRVSDEVNSIDS